MRCATCGYPLWNLKARACPECGTAFAPSEHEFVANSVRYCCPGCDQSYYGTGDRGHLVPVEFDCVTCGRHVHMDEMVLRPAQGVEERQTRTDAMPWLERASIGRAKAWLLTVGRSMVGPPRLMSAVPPQSGAGEAWRYAMVSIALICLCGWGVPWTAVGVFVAAKGGQWVTPLVTALAGVVGAPVAFALIVALWGLAAHGILLVTGGAPHGLGRTYQALCYSAGANVTTAVPCIGFYPFVWVGLLWWIVSAALMVGAAQQVKGGRASLAVLPAPILVAVLLVAGFFGAMALSLGRVAAATNSAIAAQRLDEAGATVLEALLARRRADGAWPAHALRLVEDGDVDPVRLGLDPAALPAAAPPAPDVVAHRVGDYVFTYHGIDLDGADPELWVLVTAGPAPGEDPALAPEWRVIGTAGGTTETIPQSDFARRLADQNDLRAAQGLPPLPPLDELTPD